MAKKVKAVVTLQIQAGKANPAPPDRPGAGAAWYQPDGVLQRIQCSYQQWYGRCYSGGNHHFHRWVVQVQFEKPAYRIPD